MKIDEIKLVLKIKELAEGILAEHPDSAKATAIISLCDIVDCGKIAEPSPLLNTPIPRTFKPPYDVTCSDTVSFQNATEEQHGK